MAKAWRPVPGYPHLEVSEDLQFRRRAYDKAYVRPSGTVSVRHFPAKRLRVSWAHEQGYGTISHERRPIACHVLVCLAFHGLPPSGKTKALHSDDDPTNFTPENLYWGDAKDNAKDAIKNGGMAYGERHGSRTSPHRFGKARIALLKTQEV